MKKWVKAIAATLGIVILLAIFAGILLVTLVNPNRFKPLIAEQVQKQTGRQLTMDGELAWSFYPYLGIKVGHMQLSNPPGFTQKIFVELDSATIGVKLLPLLYTKVESSGVTLHGLKMNLIKNANGQTNWSFVQETSDNKSNKTDASKKAAMVIAVTGVDVSDATINWIDETTKQQFTIDQFDLRARDITLDRPFPIKTKFHFADMHSAMSGQIALSANALLDVNNQFYQLKKTDFSAEIKKNNKNYKINTTANIVVDMKAGRAEVRNWQGEFGDIQWTGQIDVTRLKTKPYLSGSIQTQPFKLAEDALKANQVKADITFNIDTGKQAPTMLQKIIMHGLVKAETLQIKNIKATDLIAKIQLENGLLNFTSISAILYQGNLQSDANVNLANAELPVTVNAKLTNIQAEPLIADLSQGNSSVKVKGAGNIDLHLTTMAKNNDLLLRSLNGNGKFSFDNGVLQGIDIAYWMNSAYAITKSQSPSGSDSHQTNFGNLTGTMTIHNGVMSNDDLVIDMPRVTTHGKGTIDLIGQLINYSLKTQMKSDPESRKSMANFYIPILVTGHLDHPNVSLDMADLTKQIAQQQLEKVKGKALEKIEQQLPGAGGAILQNLLGQ